MFSLSSFLFLTATSAHRAHHEQGSVSVANWSAPGGVLNLDVGGENDALVPSLVPPAGTTYTFKVGQYKKSPLSQMEYDWVLHKVNSETVDLRFAWSKGAGVYKRGSSDKAWKLRRRFGAARWFGGHLADSLYFLKTSGKSERMTVGASQANWHDAKYTIRRIQLTVPQRWTIHKGFTMGGAPGTPARKQYEDSRIYWIRGDRGKYNVFRSGEDSAVWYCAHKMKTSCRGRKGKSKEEVEPLRVATFEANVEGGRKTHTVVVKEGVDAALMLSMLSVFRWEHFVGVSQVMMPIAQARGDYQPDDGIVPSHSSGSRPSLLETDSVSEADMDDLDDEELEQFFDEAEYDGDEE